MQIARLHSTPADSEAQCGVGGGGQNCPLPPASGGFDSAPRSQPRSYLPGKVRNIFQGPEGPTALVPAVTPRPGAVGEDAKGESVGLEPGGRDEAKGRDAG